MITTVKFLDYSLATNPLTFKFNRKEKITINTLNQYSYCIGERDLAFKEALKGSDILLPDGIGIVKACRYLTGHLVKKFAGADMHQNLLKQLNQEKGKCFYLGSSKNTLNRISMRIAKEYPFVNVDCYSPPFKSIFNEEDISEMIENINIFEPDVVFLGLTAPKQEKLSHIFKERLNTSVICSIGAVFDFYAETVSRPSRFWINMDLEWLIRFIKEPRRMWKRYLYYGVVFAYLIIKKKTMLAKYK